MTRRQSGPTGAGAIVEAATAAVAGGEVIVVSNREPYAHEYEDGEVVVSEPAGGLTAALDPVMQAVGGRWVAWGSGEADAVAAPEGTLWVPPGEGQYRLDRVALTDEQVEGYYRGFSNQVLWPACHCQVGKIRADPEFWTAYRSANEAFAGAVLDAHEPGSVVWFQDYHLALAPRAVREAVDDRTLLAQFWHVPWPPADVFAAVPHHRELLRGLLANDLLGVHVEGHRRNVLACADRLPGATVDWERSTVALDGHRTAVRAFPLGVEVDAVADRAGAGREAADSFLEARDVDPADVLAIGVDRLDYTKGIPTRLAGLERFLAEHPEFHESFTYVQKATESRSEIPEYQAIQSAVADAVDRVNDRFGTGDWQPVVYETDHLPAETVAGLYRLADLALVTPLRDGMNLVAQEYVAANADGAGVLVLSELAGASDALGGAAVLVHPHDPADVARGIERAVTMPTAHRRGRMAALGEAVRRTDVRTWARRHFDALAWLRPGRGARDRP